MLARIACISSSVKARIESVRTPPAEASCRLIAAPVSSSGRSPTETRSYGPSVQRTVSIVPPLLSTSCLAAWARLNRVLRLRDALVRPAVQRDVLRQSCLPHVVERTDTQKTRAAISRSYGNAIYDPADRALKHPGDPTGLDRPTELHSERRFAGARTSHRLAGAVASSRASSCRVRGGKEPSDDDRRGTQKGEPDAPAERK
jgi:hypothetical protein